MKPKPTVLLTETIHPKYLVPLEKRTRVVRPTGFDEASLAEVVAREQVDAIIIRTKGCVTAKIIAASPKLKVIGRHGVGYDHIDVEAAAKAGVWVVTTPEGSRLSVTEHTWSMILGLARKTIPGDRAVRADNFNYRDKARAFQLHGKTLGVIGLGRIGTSVALAGARGFGMKILYNDIVRYPAKEKKLGAKKVPLKTLLQKSDVVTIHTPLDKSTRELIGARELSWMQPHALLINCARGAIIKLDELAVALKNGRPGGAGLDVFEPEPLPKDHPLLSLDNVTLAPHFGAQTAEANLGYAAVVEDVYRVLAGKAPLYPVLNLKSK
jgi:D-3-phosphoglycerate dehydrogenase / 2-oxoglutarate reductase